MHINIIFVNEDSRVQFLNSYLNKKTGNHLLRFWKFALVLTVRIIMLMFKKYTFVNTIRNSTLQL